MNSSQEKEVKALLWNSGTDCQFVILKLKKRMSKTKTNTVYL